MKRALVLVAFCGCRQVLGLQDPTITDAIIAAGAHQHYVASRIAVPTNSSDTQAFGFDLDGNGTIDNAFGQFFTELSAVGEPAQNDSDALVLRGDVIALVDLQTTDFTTAAGASIRVQVGSDPMPAACQMNETVTCAVQGCAGCGRHLSPVGGAFQLPDSHFDDAALGTIESGAFTTANPGFFNVQIPIGNATAVEIPLLFGHASFTSGSPDSLAALRVGGMILDSNVETVFIPALAAQFQALVVRDCNDATHPPDCGCLLNSAGKNVIGLFDKTPADCKVPIDEVKNNGLLQTLFTPDVTIGDVSGVSYGVQMTVEHASF